MFLNKRIKKRVFFTQRQKMTNQVLSNLITMSASLNGRRIVFR